MELQDAVALVKKRDMSYTFKDTAQYEAYTTLIDAVEEVVNAKAQRDEYRDICHAMAKEFKKYLQRERRRQKK